METRPVKYFVILFINYVIIDVCHFGKHFITINLWVHFLIPHSGKFVRVLYDVIYYFVFYFTRDINMVDEGWGEVQKNTTKGLHYINSIYTHNYSVILNIKEILITAVVVSDVIVC
ncbi:hypothetical protein DGG96_16695 [Legionella qingyii]|uniref:Uncharacterized protein n=1 Tax=Legionella qingyii TaxID=2184757 RepID=A0A317TY39_9GAMM|nr:hypothetical protein DGG96_16695 [Legionella qingyii]